MFQKQCHEEERKLQQAKAKEVARLESAAREQRAARDAALKQQILGNSKRGNEASAVGRPVGRGGKELKPKTFFTQRPWEARVSALFGSDPTRRTGATPAGRAPTTRTRPASGWACPGSGCTRTSRSSSPPAPRRGGPRPRPGG